jgi:hypothetical protein
LEGVVFIFEQERERGLSNCSLRSASALHNRQNLAETNCRVGCIERDFFLSVLRMCLIKEWLIIKSRNIIVREKMVL